MGNRTKDPSPDVYTHNLLENILDIEIAVENGGSPSSEYCGN